MSANLPTEQIIYRFELASGQKIEFPLHFDKKTFTFIPADAPAEPWTALDYHKCKHCPLNAQQTPLCPIARGLQQVAMSFRDVPSYEESLVVIITPNRTISKQVTVQEGLFAVFGLIMATSGCPYFHFLRPLAFFHLPFTSLEEYGFRFLSMYLLQQHMNRSRGLPSDFELKKADQLFDDITQVNSDMVGRIRTIAKRDANLNSLTMLDAYAQLFKMDIATGHKALEPFFFPEG